jgi:hypothetical protein
MLHEIGWHWPAVCIIVELSFGEMSGRKVQTEHADGCPDVFVGPREEGTAFLALGYMVVQAQKFFRL